MDLQARLEAVMKELAEEKRLRRESSAQRASLRVSEAQPGGPPEDPPEGSPREQRGPSRRGSSWRPSGGPPQGPPEDEPDDDPPGDPHGGRASGRPSGATRYLDLGLALKSVGRFDGTDVLELDGFLCSCDAVFARIRDDDYDNLLALVLSCKIVGKASRELKHKTIYTLEQMKTELEALYGHRKSLSALQMEFNTLQQKSNEDVAAFAARTEKITVEVIEKLCESVSSEREARTVEKMTRKSAQANFENGLHGQVQILVRSRNYKTLHEAITGAIEISHMIQPKGGNGGSQNNHRKSVSAPAGAKKCYSCGGAGHIARDCTRKTGRVSLPAPDYSKKINQVQIVCTYCKKKGHSWQECRKRQWKKKEEEKGTGSQQQISGSRPQGGDKRFEYNKPKGNAPVTGANTRTLGTLQLNTLECMMAAKRTTRVIATTRRTLASLDFESATDTRAAGGEEREPREEATLRVLEITVPTKSATASDFDIMCPTSVQGLLTLKADTGAQCSVVKYSCIKKDALIEDSDVELQGADGSKFSPLCKAEITLKIPGKTIKHWFYVVRDEIPITVNGLLGMEFIKKHKADILKGEIFNLYGHHMPLVDGKSKIKLAPRTETIAYVATKSKRAGILSREELGKGIIMGACYTPPRGNSCVVSLINTTENVVEVERPTVTLEPVEITAAGLEAEANALSVSAVRVERGARRLQRLESELGVTHLNSEEREALFQVIKKYEDIFHLEGDKLPCTHMVEHRIPLKEGTNPIKVHPYRLPEMQKREVEKQTNEMLEDGIIRHSRSQWNAPLLVVAKKPDATGTKRMRVVVDFRKLNEATIGDSYPLPNITEILDQLGKAQYYSTLDLASGFHQIPMAKEDMEKTAFSTPQGHFEYTRMPFGLKNAPPTFQRLMNSVLAGMQGVKCYVYLDDIVVYGKNLREHNERLTEIFQRLREAKLSVQPRKCQFLRKETNFLGHVISEDGVRADPEKLIAVKEYPIPKTVKQVQSFLGLAGYYRKFIRDFSKIAKPLTELIKKDTKFEWTAERDAAFEELKTALTTAPVLQYPDFEQQFLVTTDASDKAIGAILSQGKIGEDLPICYASRTLSKAEINYSTTEKELLAIVWAVAQFRPYIYGTHFKVITDHQPLTWLFGVKDPGSRLMRWRIKLSEHEFDVEYKAGKRNTNADALSRIFVTTRAQAREGKGEETPAGDAKERKETESSRNSVRKKEIEGDTTQASNGPHRHANTLKPCAWGHRATDDGEKGEPEKSEQPTSEKRKRGRPRLKQRERDTASPQPANSQPGTVRADCKQLNRPEEAESGEEQEISQNRKKERDVTTENEHRCNSDVACPSLEDREKILKEYHDAPLGGHQGIKRTLARIRMKYAWPGMKKQTEEYIAACDKCQINKLKSKGRMPMVITDTPEKAFQKVAVDIVGPLPETLKGNKNILTFQDSLTKFSAAVAIPNQEAHTVAKALVEEIICRYGTPEVVLSDQGTNFLSSTFKEACKLLKIKKIQTTAYHPESNGALERSHRTLAEYLKNFINEDQNDWDEWLPYAMFTYNTTPHTATGLSPYVLVFGREAELPTALKQEPRLTYTHADYAAELRERLRASWTVARRSLCDAKERAKQSYDARARPQEYRVGDTVLLHDETVRRGRSAKLTPSWTGPYTIEERQSPVTYVIKRGRKMVTVHANRLRPYVEH